jgi:hypothetical protein
MRSDLPLAGVGVIDAANIDEAVSLVAGMPALAADPVPADFKNAAKYCKALRASKGVEAFDTQYGKNENKQNAYGKCVSSTAKAKAENREDAAEAKAAACRKQKAEDAAKFAAAYKNLGQCVKARQKTD